MARTGIGNFTHSTHAPVLKDVFWREVLNRERWDGQYHPANIAQHYPSYADLSTTNNDYFGRTWHILNNTYSAASRKSSYALNTAKPTGNVVDRCRADDGAIFHPWRPLEWNAAGAEAGGTSQRSHSKSSGRGGAGQVSKVTAGGDSERLLRRTGSDVSSRFRAPGRDPFDSSSSKIGHPNLTRSRSDFLPRMAMSHQPEVPSFQRILNI